MNINPPLVIPLVAQDTIRRTMAGDGRLWPSNQASITPKIAAPVQRFLVQRGDHVKEGQLVAVLESRYSVALSELQTLTGVL